MTLIGAGISHRTAAVEDRERFAVSSDDVPRVLEHYRREFGNAVVLSTCNRTEIYVHASDARGEVPPEELLRQLMRLKGLDPAAGLPDYLAWQGSDVARHLFSVAAGVDSMVLGEGQILGQVRTALGAAREARSLDPALSRLLHEAIRTGKRARAETNISRYAVSVSSAAVNLVRQHVPSLAECHALVVGAGDTGKLAARALRDHGVRRIVVTNRTQHRADELAAYLGGETRPFAQLDDALAEADVVITSSSAPNFIVTKKLVERAMQRRETPLMFMDVAVPRDIDPTVADVPGVRLFDIDDLQAVSESNLKRREAAAGAVMEIVDEATGEFEAWIEARRAVPTIRALVDHAETVRSAELERTVRDLALDGATAEKLDLMTAAIIKKLLHEPINYIKGADDSEDAAATLRNVFAIEES